MRENLVGKTMSASDASLMIRQSFHEQQMKPYREIYPDLDARLKAAKEGEVFMTHQIEILKLQSEHADEMFKKSLENARMQLDFEKKLLLAKSQAEKEKAEEKISALEKELAMQREYAKDLERKNTQLSKAIDHSAVSLLDLLPVIGKKRREMALEELRKEEKERSDFTLSVLGNSAFSAEQIQILLPVLNNKKVPLGALKRLCVPSLPAQNMKAFVRFIEGGNAHEAKP